MSKRIIILIPHYNKPKALLASIKSIQEPFDVDLMIVDDGSRNCFDEKSLTSVYHSGIIHFVYLPKNRGIEHALNAGLDQIKTLDYQYIARLDCGDLFLPHKLEKQLGYLQKYPEVKLIGTFVNFINQEGKSLYTLTPPTTYTALKNKMYVNCMFIHPTVVFSSEILESIGNYPTNRPYAEDYAYFFKIIKRYKAVNFPEILLDCIIEENSISEHHRVQQVKSRLQIIRDHFYFGFYPIYGYIRSLFLLFMPRKFVNSIKHILSKTQR